VSGGPVEADEPLELSAGMKVAFRILLPILVLVGSAVVAEVGLRGYGFRVPGFYDADGNPVGTGGTGAHGGPFPQGPGRLVSRDFDVAYVVNHHGFREREPEAKVPGEWRIGLVGDSHTAGYGVLTEQRFGELYAAARGAMQPEARLWNLGLPSTGADHLAVVLGGVGASYDLDEIILAISGANELGDNARVAKQPNRPAKRPRSRFALAIRDNSRLALLMWFYVVHGRLFERAPPTDFVDKLQRLWPFTEAGLDHFLEVVDGRPFQIWYLPSTLEWSDYEFERSGLSPEDRHGLRDHIRDWASRRDVAFIDASPFLTGRPSDEVKFDMDAHYNAAGHRLVAEAAIARMAGTETHSAATSLPPATP
jgi:hypothetical protein